MTPLEVLYSCAEKVLLRVAVGLVVYLKQLVWVETELSLVPTQH